MLKWTLADQSSTVEVKSNQRQPFEMDTPGPAAWWIVNIALAALVLARVVAATDEGDGNYKLRPLLMLQ